MLFPVLPSFEFTLLSLPQLGPLKLHYDKLNYINNMNGCIKFIGFYSFTTPENCFIYSRPSHTFRRHTTTKTTINKITQ